jgi:predicted ABC-type ATPase
MSDMEQREVYDTLRAEAGEVMPDYWWDLLLEEMELGTPLEEMSDVFEDGLILVMASLDGDPVQKHGSHDQRAHGRWAKGSDYSGLSDRRRQAMESGDTRRSLPRDAQGRVANPDATGGYKAGIPESVPFKGETVTPEHSLWHHLESDGKGGYRITEERAAVHRKIVQDATSGVPESSDPTFYMLGGGTAAGKTTAIKSGLADVPDQTKAVQINSDDIKGSLSEYERMRMSDNDSDFFNAAAFTHEESSYLAKQVQKAAVRNRQDMVLDGTGDSTPERLQKKIGQAREGDYRVVGVYATVPTSDALRRSNARSLKEGERRFVPEAVVRGSHRDVSRALPAAIKGGWFDRVTLIDTSSRGKAKQIGSGSGTSWQVTDPRGWQDFLDKGNE